MTIYEDKEYTTPYTSSPIELSTADILYVGVYIADENNSISSNNDFKLLMINCYSTPDKNINNKVRYDILIDKCPKDSTLHIVENGQSNQGRFYLQMFTFIGDYQSVYVHCEVYLCNDDCDSDCRGTGRRSNLEPQGRMTVGPIRAENLDGNSVGNSVGYYYVNSSSYYNVSCSSDSKGLPSLTYVVDTTGSMSYQPIRDFTSVIYNQLLASSSNGGRQYTLMEFNDPSVGPLRATCSIYDFYNNVYYLSISGGGDCPEYAMVGLLKALESSPTGSVVVLATDASAKDAYDAYTVNRIFSLIDSKKVKVFILGPNACGSSNEYDFQVYRDIASRSYGHVFQNCYTSTKIGNFLYYFLQTPINSTTQLLSLDGSSISNISNFYVSTNFSALIISAACQSCSVFLYPPSGAGSVINESQLISENWGSLSYVNNPKTGSWKVSFSSGGYFSLRIVGFKASICASCSPYATCRKIIFSYSCVCNDGFSGDGYSCYDTNECYYYSCNNGYCVNTFGSYYCSCYSGYTFDIYNKTCVDINECLNSSLSNCHSLATCVNYLGSYSCYCPYGYYGDGYHCEVDECSKDVCGFGQECIKSNKSHSCLDPCYNYTSLNDPTRSTNYYYDYYYYYYGRSDSYFNGWYRFIGSGGIRMPEFCPSSGHCYTIAPLWLNGSHPDISDGIVNRTVCTSYYGNCCYWTSNVMIRACPGGYHVYKLSGTPYYYSGYCTDPSTSAESCSCADDEECRLVGGHFGCYCKKTDVSALGDLRPVLSCGSLEIKASFNKCQLQKLNLNTNNIHLRDKNCIGFPDYNNTNTISVLSVLRSGVCGNDLVNNKTHIIYKNTIYLSLNTGSSLGGEDVLTIDYACVYPLDMELSIDTALIPFASSVNSTITAPGDLLVTMALYQDSGYTSVYEGSEVLLTSKTNLYIGIILKSGDTSQLTVQMKNCFATPTNNQNSSSKYYIIRDSCPSKQDSSISVIENGKSEKGRFSVQLFGYIQESNVAYLHCQIHICNKTSETCSPSCSGARAAVAESRESDSFLHLGPIIRQDIISTDGSSGNGAESVMTGHLTASILLLILGRVFLI
ncbi:uromodulin-like [Gastrophryne carolinensis]